MKEPKAQIVHESHAVLTYPTWLVRFVDFLIINGEFTELDGPNFETLSFALIEIHEGIRRTAKTEMLSFESIRWNLAMSLIIEFNTLKAKADFKVYSLFMTTADPDLDPTYLIGRVCNLSSELNGESVASISHRYLKDLKSEVQIHDFED